MQRQLPVADLYPCMRNKRMVLTQVFNLPLLPKTAAVTISARKALGSHAAG